MITLKAISATAGVILLLILIASLDIWENHCPKCGRIMSQWSSDPRKDYCEHCDLKKN